jgi:hypothetical protein
MTLGPGKYDDLCTYCAEQTGVTQHGGGVILIVIGGDKGNGFDVQADFATTLALPDMLEYMAREIRADMEGSKQ